MSESALRDVGYALVSRNLATNAVQGYTVQGDAIKSTIYAILLQKL